MRAVVIIHHIAFTSASAALTSIFHCYPAHYFVDEKAYLVSGVWHRTVRQVAALRLLTLGQRKCLKARSSQHRH